MQPSTAPTQALGRNPMLREICDVPNVRLGSRGPSGAADLGLFNPKQRTLEDGRSTSEKCQQQKFLATFDGEPRSCYWNPPPLRFHSVRAEHLWRALLESICRNVRCLSRSTPRRASLTHSRSICRAMRRAPPSRSPPICLWVRRGGLAG